MRDYLRRMQEIARRAKEVEQKKIVIYGAGTNGLMLLNFLQRNGLKIFAFWDSRAEQVQMLDNIPVISPESLTEKNWKESFVIVSTLIESFTQEINKILENHGLCIEKDYLNMCEEHFFDNAPVYKSFDPFLGYSKLLKQPDKNKNKVFVLGNSTSYRESGKTIFVEETWVDILGEYIGDDYQICNCSFPAYTSAQELIKLIRDCIPYKPDIVLSLSGLVDAEHVRTLSEYPFYTRYQKDVLEYAFESNNGKYNGVLDMPNEIELGERDDSDYSEVYLRNIKMINGICESLDITYYSFLQPTLFWDNSCLNNDEEEVFNFLYPTHSEENISGQSINYKARKDAKCFFENVKSAIKKMDFAYDLTEIFHGETEVYKDARHYTPKGHRILAKKIAAILQRK